MTFKRIRRRIEALRAGLGEAARRYTRSMSEGLHLTIVYERDPDSDWIFVSVPEVPGVLSQGKTREEAREMVLDALAGMLDLQGSEFEPEGMAVECEPLAILS